MPGGRLLGPAALAVVLAAATVGARAAAAWRPTLHPSPHDTDSLVANRPAWPRLLADAAQEAATDWRGSMLIAAAIAACAVLGVELPVLLPVLPGLLVLAAVTVRGRRRTDPGG